MVPVPVHKVVSYISRGLVQCRVGVGRCLDVTVYRAQIHYPASVRGQFEFAHPFRYVRDLCLFDQFRVCAVNASDRCSPYLPFLDIGYALAPVDPTRAADAAAFARELSLASPVRIGNEEIAAAAVL